MIVPEFIRFYGYTLEQVLSEYAISFYSLVNSMFRIKANEMLDGISVAAVVNSGSEGRNIVDNLKKQSRGIHGIVQEVKVAQQFRSKAS